MPRRFSALSINVLSPIPEKSVSVFVSAGNGVSRSEKYSKNGVVGGNTVDTIGE